MSENKLPKDILSEVAYNRPTKAPQKGHNSDTKSIQEVHKDNTLDIHHIRIHKNDWNKLRDYFEGIGLKTSPGIRMLIKEFMERKGL